MKLFSLIFFLLILNIYYLVLTTSFARAEGLSLSASHSLLQVQAIPPADAKSPFTLENTGDSSINVQVLFKPFHASRKENGEIEYINDNEIPDSYKKIFKQIHVTDDGIITSNFELGPKQKKNLELQFTIPKNESSSDYYFSVIFLASPNQEKLKNELDPVTNSNEEEPAPLNLDTNTQNQNFSTINAGIALNILLSIGKNQPQGAIEEFSAPTLIKSGPVGFTVRIKNIGSRLFAPKSIILIKNVFGQTVGRVDIQPDNILPGSIRALTDSQTASNSSQLSDPKAIWPEKLLLGPYTATLSIAISDKGPLYNQSITFLALPVQLILGIIIAIIVTIIIFLRVRYHLKNDK